MKKISVLFGTLFTVSGQPFSAVDDTSTSNSQVTTVGNSSGQVCKLMLC